MKLTLHTRHALRLLAHLAAEPGRPAPIADIGRAWGMPHNHLMKIVAELRRAGFVESIRGRNGGIRLARPAREITLGELVQHTERRLDSKSRAARNPHRPPEVEHLFKAAFTSFFATLDRLTVADIARQAEPSRASFEELPQ